MSPADCCSTTARLADSVKNLAALPLLFNPGDRFEYSLGVDVLGRLVEVVSGKPLDEFFRTRIFEPLGMKDTYFYPPENKVDRLATAYTYYPDKGLNRFPDTPIRGRVVSCIRRIILRAGRRSCFPAERAWSPPQWTMPASAR